MDQENQAEENESVVDEEEEPVDLLELIEADENAMGLNAPAFQHRIDALTPYRPFIVTTVLGSFFHPIAFVVEARRLGYEPFALSLRPTHFFFGPKMLFTNSVLTYLYQHGRAHGFGSLFCGYETAMLMRLINGAVQFYLAVYLNVHHPTIGGEPLPAPEPGTRPSGQEMVRRQIRSVIRGTVQVVIASIASQPFRVLFCREVAQQMGGECKYVGNVLTKFQQIGSEEGLGGLFAGLVPALMYTTISLWINAGFGSFFAHCVRWFEIKRPQPFSLLVAALPRFVDLMVYPLRLYVSQFAIRGSGLTIATRPYISRLRHWTDAREYFVNRDRMHGFGFFGRPYWGPVQMGLDRRFYIVNDF